MTDDPDKLIIVPLAVETAYLTEDEQLLGAYADFSALSSSGYRERNVTFLPDKRPQRGIYLQWSLPAPLNSGWVNDSSGASKDDVTFPPAPNRWLVVRLPFPRPGRLEKEAWIIESDYCSSNPELGGVSVPTQQGNAYVGRCVPLREWTPAPAENSTERVLGWKLTAAGWGDPMFSAYYPSSQNIFGFRDPLRLPDGTEDRSCDSLSYLVVGWHSQAEDDILFDTSRLREALAWALPGDTESAVLKTMRRSIYSGFVPGIPMPSHTGNILDNSRVTAGNTMQEALTALLANHRELPAKQRILNAALSDLKKSPPRIDNRDCHVDDELHALRFLTKSGGNLWSVRVEHKTPAREADDVEPPLPAAVVQPLAELNAAQSELDYATQLWLARRREIRDDISLLEQITSAPQSSGAPESSWPNIRAVLRERMEKDLAAIYRIDLQALEARTQLAKLQVESEILVLNSDVFRKFELNSTPAPRFWRPRDPVVLVQHDRLQTNPRYDARFSLPDLYNEPFVGVPDSFLRCRTAASLKKAYPANGLANWPTNHLPFSDVLGSLVSQAIVFSNGRSVDEPLSYFRRPVYLRWKAVYLPLAGTSRYSETSLRKRWIFSQDPPAGEAADPQDQGDLAELRLPKERPQGVSADTAKINYSGISIVEPTATMDFLRQIALLKESGMCPEIVPGEGDLRRKRVVSTSLESLHDQMLMYSSGFDLPLRSQAGLLGLAEIPAWLENRREGDAMRPDPSMPGFSPLRAGFLEIVEMTFVDTFGRLYPIITESRMRGDRFTASMSLSRMESHERDRDHFCCRLLLPPRLASAARLNFRLESFTGGKSATASPLCGWIIPSHIEAGLILCEPDGTMTGMLRNRSGKPVFLAAPGRALSDLQGHFRELVDAILASGDFLTTLLQTLLRETMLIVPEERHHFPGMGELMGRPLAVVTAELGIDILGDLLPRMQAFSESDQGDNGLRLVEIPIQLGDPDRRNDGLAAFFLGQPSDGKFDFKEIWTPSGSLLDAAKTHPSLRISSHGQSRRQSALMLVDPRAPIHATTGLLPAKAIAIPPAYYKAARKKLGVLFPCGPLLLDHAANWTLPLKPLENQRWHWSDAARVKDGEVQWSPVAEASPLPTQSDLPAAAEIAGRIWLTLRPEPPAPVSK